MNHKIMALLLTVLLGFAGHSFAQSARESMHIVQPGETLAVIAARYEVDLNDLAALNGIYNYHRIYSWQELEIPSLADEEASIVAGDRSHVIRYGETLSMIAERYGVDLTELKELNDLYGKVIYPGHELLLPSPTDSPLNTTDAAPTEKPAQTSEPEPASPPPGDYFEHTIQFGETLGTLAINYGLTIHDLLTANSIDDANRIESGQTLWIPASATRQEPPPPQLPKTAHRPAIGVPVATVAAGGRDLYVVQPGDHLSAIARKMETDWVAMVELNGIVNPNILRVGMTLLVPNSDDLIKYGASYSQGGYNLYDNHPGPHVGKGREIVIVLSTQSAYGYEDGILQKAALVSTGRPKTPTVQGNFAIRLKRRSQRMTGDDYDLDNVEWVMYFYQGYALHGAWWHNNFGQRESHGCVNMTNADAKWFYDFASLGTPVRVQYY